MQKININVNSEIGKLEGVIIHQPGSEIESMSPENAAEALYSDILNLSVALPEYNGFSGVLKKFTKVFEVSDLLEETLNDTGVKEELINSICANEQFDGTNTCSLIADVSGDVLAKQLIQGIEMSKDNLTKFLNNDLYCFNPLPNLFFTRDASFSVGNEVIISSMASKVRIRETLIMDTIFKYHPLFKSTTVNPVPLYDKSGKGTIEGGDVLIARDDILIIGNGDRTNTQGIDSMIEHVKTKLGTNHVIVQQLPHNPESFIHLDMVFTLLDKNTCMIFEPLILEGASYATVHITIENHKVKSIRNVSSILTALHSLGMDLEPVFCGGKSKPIIMKREQWHSGANFFTLEPGKIVGYARNVNTIEALNKAGFDVVTANEIISGSTTFADHDKLVVTIQGNELARGGGGARCMSMPVSRQKVEWF
ncbi:MAG: arginine deiminase family protein [Bacteroidota bacterium]